jgi:predicted phage terminase large subunit-like protein
MNIGVNLNELEQEVFDSALQKIAQRCRYDLYYLAKYILGYDKMEEHVHGDLCDYTRPLLQSLPPEYKLPPETGEKKGLESQFLRKNNNLLLLMPRGTFKSSVITIGFSLQFILNDPDCRILIDSETYGKAKAFLMEIKGHLEMNEKYRAVFKAIHGVYPNETKRKQELLWTNVELNIAARKRWRKEPTFSCAGIDVTKNGMHYDLIICDDLHSEKNVTSKEQIEQVIDHWKLAYSLLDPNKPMIIIGTRWHELDLYQHILDNERDRFNILIKRAIRHDGTLLFPEVLDQEFLDRTKKTQGTSMFYKQYMNEPVDDETATFKRSYIIHKPWEEIQGRPINWYLSVDPSYEGEYSDFAALVVAGMDFMRNIYVRHIIRQKMTYSDIINAIFDLHNKFRVKNILLETVATQKSIGYELTNEQRRRGYWLPVTEIRFRAHTKEERIRGLAPLYEFGHVYHIKECPQLDELEYELLRFPTGKHDDVIDALANVLEFATPPAPTKAVDTIGRKQRVLYKPRSPITGV